MKWRDTWGLSEFCNWSILRKDSNSEVYLTRVWVCNLVMCVQTLYLICKEPSFPIVKFFTPFGTPAELDSLTISCILKFP